MKGDLVPDTWGDQAFEAFFAAQSRRLRKLAYAMCGDWHMAEDITQATFGLPSTATRHRCPMAGKRWASSA